MAMKVGDKVKMYNSLDSISMGILPAGTEGEITEIVIPGYEYKILFEGPSGITSTFYLHPTSFSPSAFWIPSPAQPTFQPGDRVVRQELPDAPAGIPPGTHGTVSYVRADHISIVWDGYGDHGYDLPLRNNLFSKVSPLQSPRQILHCKRCGEYNEYAEPNQPDGVTHKCYLCRTYPYR